MAELTDIRASLVAHLVKNPPGMQKTPVWFLGQEDPLEKQQSTHASLLGLPCGSAGKESACNAVDLGLIPGLGRSLGEGKGYPLQYFGLENSTGCIVHGVAKNRTQMNAFHIGGGNKIIISLPVWHRGIHCFLLTSFQNMLRPPFLKLHEVCPLCQVPLQTPL